MTENNRNRHICTGLMAHVDSGKTTLSEALLYASGTIRKLGKVDTKEYTFNDKTIPLGFHSEKDGEKGKPGKAYASQTAGAGYAEGYDCTATAVCCTTDGEEGQP